MFHKPTVLADAQWRPVLLEVVKKTFERDDEKWLDHLITHVYALSPGERDGRAWIGILGISDSACPFLLFKHRQGEIPAREREEVPGNNLAFVKISSDPYHLMQWLNWGGDKASGCSTDAQRVLKPLCGEREMTSVYAHERLMRRRVCNAAGMKCGRLAVVVSGDRWACDEHAPNWRFYREAVLREFETEATRIEEAAKVGPLPLPESARRMARALRAEARRLRRRRCWVVKAKHELAPEGVRA